MSATIVLALRLASVFALLSFLGWTFYLLSREIKRQGAALVNRRVPGLNLTLRTDTGSSWMKYYSQPEVFIGRDPGCDLPLMDETISTRHARLAYHHNQWWVEDLNTTNGTRLNSVFVTMPTVITSGDEIQCGTIRLSVNLSGNLINEQP